MEDPVIRKDVFSQVLDTTIDRARNGDTESARKILEWFCGAIKANTDKKGNPYRKPSGIGTQIDERILRYVGECFKRILDGGPGARVDANRALGIVETGRKGNKKTKASRKQELLIGLQVRDCHVRIKAERKISKGQRLRGASSPLDEAIKNIAQKHHYSSHTVKNAYKEWNKVSKPYKEELRALKEAIKEESS